VNVTLSLSSIFPEDVADMKIKNSTKSISPLKSVSIVLKTNLLLIKNVR
jgi:ribosomal protein S3AE